MDFDRRFKRSEFVSHLRKLGYDLSELQIDDLLKRTTKTTRGGRAFSFKPNGYALGWMDDAGRLHPGFECDDIRAKEDDPRTPKRPLASTLWIHLRRDQQCFDFALLCTPHQAIPGLWPLKGRIQMRNLEPGSIQLRARQLDGDRVQAYLTLTTRHVPEVKVQLEKIVSGKNPEYERAATDADYCSPAMKERHAGPICVFGHEKALVKPAAWLTHRFSLDISLRQYKLLWMCMVRLRKLGLKPDFRNPHFPLDVAESIAKLDRPRDLIRRYSFQVHYSLECLLSTNTVSFDLGSLLERLDATRDEDKRVRMLELLDLTRGRGVREKLQALGRLHLPRVRPVPSHCFYIRRCLVTPLRLVLLPPQLETSNSILRAFSAYRDRFMRVHFAAEEGPLDVNSVLLQVDDDVDGEVGLFARVRRALRYGLDVAGRHYQFLTFGESQIKEQGCWMIAEDAPHFTRDVVLGSMGDLDAERIIAKHAARQGLALSTSRALGMEVVIEKREDIKHAGFIFTDGAGICSAAVLAKAARMMGKAYIPTAIQIRLPGMKGVLGQAPDGVLGDNEVSVRPSMIKFDSDQVVFGEKNSLLNVLKLSSYSPGYLNRQSILLLEALGISTDVLLSFFHSEKARIESIGTSVDGATYYPPLIFPAQAAVEAGFADDPMIQNITRLVMCRLLSELKWKAKIELEEAAFLMGIPDETGTLGPEEVFCQTFDDRTGRSQIIEGDCVIFRNPCLHPGDVRRVKAVNVPGLHYTKNVVVFSTQSSARCPRDLPNQLGGGDLDGDYYTLIWDERLLFRQNHAPASYPPSSPVKLDRSVTIEDTQQFYLEFILNNNLGVIANSHLATADALGPLSADAIRFAEGHNVAVDFFKTGIPVSRRHLPQVKRWPDFMGKTGQNVEEYESQNALGHMFRAIDPDPTFEPITSAPDSTWRFRDIAVPEEFTKRATEMKEDYDHDLLMLIRSHDLTSEVECVTGLPVKPNKRRMRRQNDYDRENAVREGYEHIRNAYISESEEYLKYLEESPPEECSEMSIKSIWALACYRVAMQPLTSDYLDDRDLDLAPDPGDSSSEEGVEELGEDDQPVVDLGEDSIRTLYSFGWLFSRELLELGQLRANLKSRSN